LTKVAIMLKNKGMCYDFFFPPLGSINKYLKRIYYICMFTFWMSCI